MQIRILWQKHDVVFMINKSIIKSQQFKLNMVNDKNAKNICRNRIKQY